MDINNTRFYYAREKRGSGSHPIACVCIIRDKDGKMWRGVSICSKKDGFVKATARNIAKRNAEFIRDLNREDGTTRILGRIGSQTVEKAVIALVNINDARQHELVERGFYEKASAVSVVPLSKFEDRIWADPDCAPIVERGR